MQLFYSYRIMPEYFSEIKGFENQKSSVMSLVSYWCFCWGMQEGEKGVTTKVMVRWWRAGREQAQQGSERWPDGISV